MASIFHNDAHFLLQEHCSIQEISFLAHSHFEQFTLDSADLGCLQFACGNKIVEYFPIKIWSPVHCKLRRGIFLPAIVEYRRYTFLVKRVSPNPTCLERTAVCALCVGIVHALKEEAL